jgi:folate-binding protein YgfZ
MSAAFAQLSGAVVEDGVLRHVGNPVAEQRELAAGRAVAVLGDRRVLTVTGEDRLTWLDSLTSQAVARLAPGESTELLVLDPQGRIEHAAAVVDDGATAWLLVDTADAAPLLTFLTRMRFRLRVEVRDASEEHAVIGGTAAAVDGVIARLPARERPVWVDPWPYVSAGGWAYAAVDPHPGTERDWAEAVVDRADEAQLAASAAEGDVRIAGALAADALRIAAWRPRRADVDERALPHELDWLRTAVHLSKGCYRGQETVAKVHNLGHPPRRLIALHLDGSDSVLPLAGADVRSGDDVVGAVTSVALHFEDGPIALALVRRSLPVDAALTVVTSDGPIAAAQEVIVPPDAGATANIPRITRLSRRAASSAG